LPASEAGRESEHVAPSNKQNCDNNGRQQYQLAASAVEKTGLVGFSCHGTYPRP
jgi:hypothetical protein